MVGLWGMRKREIRKVEVGRRVGSKMRCDGVMVTMRVAELAGLVGNF